MSINTSIYGTPEQWGDAYYIQSGIEQKNKRVFFPSGYTRSYLRLGVASGKLSYSTPLDKSLSYCGMGAEMPLSNFYKVIYEDNQFKLSETDFIHRGATNFCFAERNSNADYTMMYDGLIHNVDYKFCYWYNGVDVSQSTEGNYNAEPYALVVPKNQVILIRVIAYNSAFSAHVDQDLYTYINTYAANYPNVASIYGQLWIGRTNRSTNAGQGDPNIWFATPTIIILDKNNFTSDHTYDYAYNLFFSQAYNSLPIMITDRRVYVYGGTTTAADKDCFVFGDKTKIQLHKVDAAKYIPYIPYDESFKELALRATAAYGLYFTDRQSVAENGTYTDDNIYIGLIDSNGLTHGDYLKGSATALAPQAAWTDMQQSGYDYTKAVDNTNYDNSTYFYFQLPSNAFTKQWVCTKSQVDQLAGEMYAAVNNRPAGMPVEEYNNEIFLVNNPLDAIVSILKFPVQNILSVGLPQPIKLGAYTTSIQALPLIYQTFDYTFKFDVSHQNSVYQKNGGSFLDFEPYTKADLTIPFCGTVSIPLTYIYDYDDLTVHLLIDFISGACTAVITAHGIAIDSVSGTCAITLPVSGIQKATLDQQIQSVAQAQKSQQTSLGLGLLGGAVSIGIGIATGSLPVAIGGAAAVIGSFAKAANTGEQINYDLKHMELPLKQISAASGALAQSMDMRCKLRITRPKLARSYSAAEYASTIGYATVSNGKVSNYSGFTQATIDLSGVPATAEEKNLIKQHFANGVYL